MYAVGRLDFGGGEHTMEWTDAIRLYPEVYRMLLANDNPIHLILKDKKT